MFRNLCNLLPPRNENDTFSSQVLNLAQYPPKIWQMGGFVLQMGKSECKPPRSLSIATCLLMPDANAWSWQRIYMHVSQPAPFGSHSRTQKNQDVLFRSFQSNDWLMVGLVEALGKNFANDVDPSSWRPSFRNHSIPLHVKPTPQSLPCRMLAYDGAGADANDPRLSSIHRSLTFCC
jgi:hypothetical protein